MQSEIRQMEIITSLKSQLILVANTLHFSICILHFSNFSISFGSVIASKAKQSQLSQRDCHVAPLLAMTVNGYGMQSDQLIEKLRILQFITQNQKDFESLGG